MEEEEEYDDELNWYDDKVGVVIVTTPRSYESRRFQLRRQWLCTDEKAELEDEGDWDYDKVRVGNVASPRS